MGIKTEKENKMLAQAAAEFARRALVPDRETNDRYPFSPFFETIVTKALGLDFFHLILPEDLGGAGMGLGSLCVLLEEIAREDASLAAIILTNATAQKILLAARSENVLRLRATGETPRDFLLAFPLFNNPSEVKPTVQAHLLSGGYVLSGLGEYLVLGNVAGRALIPAVDEEGLGYSFFVVDLKDSSARVGEPILSLGLHACPAVDVGFEKTGAVLVGEAGRGPEYFETCAAPMNLAAAAIAVGIMKGSSKAAMDYCRQREQGGRKIVAWSEMQMLLADMTLKVDVADMIMAEACRAVEAGAQGWQSKALTAAIHIQALATEVTTDGVQALGGVGYMQDFGQEKRFRDAKHIQASLGLAPLKKRNLLRQKM